MKPRNQRLILRYALLGAAVGFIFPLLALILELAEIQTPTNWLSVVVLLGENRALRVVWAAPFVLGVLFYNLARQKEAVIAVNEQLEEKVKARVEELDRAYKTQVILNQLLQLTLQNLPIKETLQNSLDLILQLPVLASAKQAGIFLYDKSTNSLKIAAERYLDPDAGKFCRLVPDGFCRCGAAMHGRDIQLVTCQNEISSTPRDEYHGNLYIPITVDDQLEAVMAIYIDEKSIQDNHWSTLDLESVAGDLATILKNWLNEDKLRLHSVILNHITNAVLLADPQDRVIWVNPAYTRLTGYEFQEVVGKKTGLFPLRCP